VPALVSDIGGPPWVVGEAGFTFENENPNSLHKQLHQITNEESIYKELQYNCKNRIEWFSPDRIITDVINTYHQESSSNPRK
jgi:glycosyltransferase involved in cell wall biosynthesis